jgi:HD-GYP domain-containing protein (c-di-GMP phosphodiesterase class II)
MARARDCAGGISITSALIANIALLTLVIGALCAWLMTLWGTQDIHHRTNERLADTARSIAVQMSLAMDERHADIRAVRDLFERELAGTSVEQKRGVMERTRASHKHFSWLGVVAADGGIRIGTGGLLEGMSVAGRNWFEGARKEPVFFGNLHPAKLLEPHMRNPDGAPLYLLDIALPLRGTAGEVTGVLGSHMNWRMIEEVVRKALEPSSHSERLSAAVVAADGAILYDTQGATGNAGELLKPLAPGQMIEADWPSRQEQFFLATAPTPPGHAFTGLGWRVVVRESAPAVSANIARMKWQVLGASTLAGLLFSLLGLLAVRPITLPLQALAHDMTRFGETEAMPEANVNNRIVEVRNLHNSFLSMATNVVANKELLRATQVEIVSTLARAGEFRDNETGNHVFRMSLCGERLGELAGLRPDQTEMLRLASKMHDVGKIGIPDHVLLKPGRFDDAERAIMERHCEIGALILTGVDTPLTVLARTIAMSHHEKWDGSGYPNRVAGEDIPLEGRIAAICDVFDALLSSRPYKEGWPLEKVVAFMREQAGHHFDPALIALFVQHLDDFVKIRALFHDEPSTEEGASASA